MEIIRHFGKFVAPSARVIWPALVLALSLGCGGGEEDEGPRAPFEATAAGLSLDGIPATVQGTLAGDAFEATDVRFRIETHARRKRIDLLFSDVDFSECALPLAREGRRVFLRLPGLEKLEPGEISGDPSEEEGAPSAHYEVPERRGIGRGAFRVQFDTVEQNTATGKLHVCFDDGRGSCVSGAFSARACRGPIDGFALRETGLLGEPRELAVDAPSLQIDDEPAGAQEE